METEITLTVVEVVAHRVTGFDAILGGDGQVSGIEQPVDVGSKKDAVPNIVFWLLGKRSNMRSVESRKSLLSGHCTPSRVEIGDQGAEGSLTDAAPLEKRI
jgi:hypothetical protein